MIFINAPASLPLEQSGVPLSDFDTRSKPFYVGTYFPKDGSIHYNMPGFRIYCLSRWRVRTKKMRSRQRQAVYTISIADGNGSGRKSRDNRENKVGALY